MFQWQICDIQKLNICHSLQYTVENPTVNLNSLCNSCTKLACCSSELIFTFLYVGSNIQFASEEFVSCIHLSFVNLALNPNPPTKNLTELVLETNNTRPSYVSCEVQWGWRWDLRTFIVNRNKFVTSVKQICHLNIKWKWK